MAEPEPPGRPPSPERLVAVAIVAAAALLAAAPLLAHRALPDGHDAPFALVCARAFVGAAREGVVYPRWVGDANSGFGAPTFVYYSPLAYAAVALVDFATGDVIQAIRWTLVLAAFLSAFSFYLSARDAASPRAAAAGAAFYALLPYHLLDVHERFAFAEFVAFVWFPPLFRAARGLGDGARVTAAWLGLAAAYAGLVLTHIVTAYAVLFVFVPYVLWVARRARRWSVVVAAATAGATALLCCGAYLLPAAVERGQTNFADYFIGNKAWPLNFLFRDAAARGGPADPTKPLVMAGVIAWLLVAACVAWFARSRPQTRPYLALAAWAFFLETPLATPLWATVPGLAFVQFPWRFEAFAVLLAALLAAVALAPPRPPGVAPALALAGALALGVSALVTQAQPHVVDAEYGAKEEVRWHYIVEHMPAGVDFSYPWKSLPWVQPEAYVPEGGSFETLAWTAETRRVRVTLPAGGPVVVRTFAMLGWETRLDGAPVAHRPDAKFGAIEVDVPAGAHEIEAVYGTTWDRRAGVAVSAVGLAILLGVALVALRRRRVR